MADKITPEARSANMRAIRSAGMKPELVVRSLAHRMGYRFRLHRRDLPGKPDLVFPSLKKVIFVHGCFWHQHPAARCVDARVPKSNAEYWVAKLAKNSERDREHLKVLRRSGWRCLVIWECETKRASLDSKLRRFLAKQ